MIPCASNVWLALINKPILEAEAPIEPDDIDAGAKPDMHTYV